MRTMNLEKNQKPMEKRFLQFVLPSMLTMLLSGFYTIVDGFFIGNAVGDVGLSGIGLVWPITAVLLALGMGIGASGSVLMSSCRGAGDQERANRARGGTLLLLAVASLVMTLLLVPAYPTLVRLLGARGEVYDAAADYIRVIAWGGCFQILASGLMPLIRNSGKTLHAMAIMSAGLVANIVLDWVFTMVLPWGLGGAAIATTISQAVTVVWGLACLLRLRENPVTAADFRPDAAMAGRILKVGISPFGLSLMPNFVTVLNNWQCLAYGGDSAVAAYAVVNYVLASVLLLLQGVGEGIQPLVSYCAGAGDAVAVRRLRNKGLGAVLGFSAVFFLLALPARAVLPDFFATSQETGRIIQTALVILGLAFPLLGLGKLFISFFYACGEGLASTLLVYADPLVFTPICLFLLPRWFGLEGVWMALPAAQLFTMLLLAGLLLWHRKRGGRAVLRTG